MDTPDRAILASGHVCRKREVDGQIVSLKSGQTVEGAVHRREELEVTLERELPIGQWPPSEIRDRLLEIVGDVVLVPLFDQHQMRIIRWASHADRVVAEMSVDKVGLSINGREQGYFEVEFELKVAGTEDESGGYCSVPAKRMEIGARAAFQVRARSGAGQRVIDATSALIGIHEVTHRVCQEII